MKIEVENVFPEITIKEGTLMDYLDDEFVFIVKDDVWTAFELDALQHHCITMQFVYKFDIAIFLITIDDAMDTSDFIFCCHDQVYPASLWKTFERGEGYLCSLYFLDGNNVVKGRRRMQLSSDTSNIIAKNLRLQKQQTYREEEFCVNLAGLQSAYEPFELQPLSLVTQQF